MAFLTVTPEELRNLARTCQQQSDAIGQIGQTVNSNVTSVDWHSPAAEQFRGDWTGTHQPNLQRLQQSLMQLGQAAEQMAAQYEQADASYRGA